MKTSQIAAQLYTVRKFTKTPEDIRNTFKKVRQIGYESVQLSGLGPIDPAELKSIGGEYGLKICITHTPYYRIVNDFDNVVKEHKLWQCECVGLGAMPGVFEDIPDGFERSREGYRAFARKMSEVAKKYNDVGLKFTYHNHNFEFEKYDEVTGLDILLQESDPHTFVFELDTYWVQAGGADPVEWIYKVKGRMKVVHLKDMAIVDGKQVFAEIGEGNLNWDKIIKACEETGVEWYAVEQDVCRRDPFEILKMSFDYLTKKYCR